VLRVVAFPNMPAIFGDLPLEALHSFLDTISLEAYGATCVATRMRYNEAYYAWNEAIVRDFDKPPIPHLSAETRQRLGVQESIIAHTRASRAMWLYHLARIEGPEVDDPVTGVRRRRGRFARAIVYRHVAARIARAVAAFESIAASTNCQEISLAPPPSPESGEINAFEDLLKLSLPAAARALFAETGGQRRTDQVMSGLLGGVSVYDKQVSMYLLPGGLAAAAISTRRLRHTYPMHSSLLCLTGMTLGIIFLDCVPHRIFEGAGDIDWRPRGALYAASRTLQLLPAARGAGAAPSNFLSAQEGPLEDTLVDWLEARVKALEAERRGRRGLLRVISGVSQSPYIPSWPSSASAPRGMASLAVTRGVRIEVSAVLLSFDSTFPPNFCISMVVSNRDEFVPEWSSLWPALSSSLTVIDNEAAASTDSRARRRSLRSAASQLVYTYRVTLDRVSEREEEESLLPLIAGRTLALKTRSWRFCDLKNPGVPRSVSGPGVIGLFPRLEPPGPRGEPTQSPFEYASMTEVDGGRDIGNLGAWMEGSLNFDVLAGSEQVVGEIQAAIARFSLEIPDFLYS
jgi:hypothetical protein